MCDKKESKQKALLHRHPPRREKCDALSFFTPSPQKPTLEIGEIVAVKYSKRIATGIKSRHIFGSV
jgi:hypothetical protein